MQFFKHYANMRHDIKLKRIINRYGLEGYGLYNLILEAITEKLTTESPIPALHETCMDIAEFYNSNSAKIEEMVNFMINQGLFELDEITGRIICNKLYKFLEQNQTRSKEIRAMIRAWKNKQPNLIELNSVSDGCETGEDKSDRTEQNRTEKEEEQNNKKTKKKKKTTPVSENPPTEDEIIQYVKDNNYPIDAKYFYKYFTEGNWKDSEGKIVYSWKQKVITWAGRQKKADNEQKTPSYHRKYGENK